MFVHFGGGGGREKWVGALGWRWKAAGAKCWRHETVQYFDYAKSSALLVSRVEGVVRGDTEKVRETA